MSKTINFPASAELYKLVRAIADKRDSSAMERISDAEIGRFVGFESARTSRWKHGQIAVHDATRLIALSQSLDVDLTVLTHVASGYINAEEALEILSDVGRLVRFLGDQIVLPADDMAMTLSGESVRFNVIRRSLNHYRRHGKRIGKDEVSAPEDEPVVLLVDDSRTTIRYFKNMTGQDTGLRGIVARSGPEALIAAGQWRPRLIIFDIFIGLVDGFAAIRSLVGEAATSEAEVIATSLSLSQDIVRSALGSGAVEVLQRPLQARALTVILNRIRGRG